MKRGILNIVTFFLIIAGTATDICAQKDPGYEVKRMSFNSSTFSEISPVIVDDGIIFCSNRRFSSFKDRTTFEGNRLYNIYVAQKKDSSDWHKPEELKGERSSLFNNGPLCISPDGRTVYFTSEVETGKSAQKKGFKNHNGIFIAQLSGNRMIGLKPFQYNNSQYEVAQPSISSDGRYLFFASDMPGGEGGADIYYCEFVNGEWAPPVNLGANVNSSSTENFPYMHPSGRLYFSSDRPGGLGNLDVYSTSLSYGEWEIPVPLPEPINSDSDDFAFVAGDDLQSGYFSSNRQYSDDIYEFSTAIVRLASCDLQEENSYCYQFTEENAVKFDTMPFRYEWKFGDGQQDNGAVVIHCYDSPGIYVARLDVVNLITKEVMYNEKTDTLIVTDIEQPYISCPDSIKANNSISFSADSTNLPGWNIVKYYWNFGDGSIAIGKEVKKAYKAKGTYNIQLIVSEEAVPGIVPREACVSKNIIVTEQPR